MMLIEFTGLPEGHFKPGSRRTLLVSLSILARGRLFEHLLLNSLVSLVGWCEVRRVQFRLSVVVDYLLV